MPVGPHPEPPADLPRRSLRLIERPGPWFRIYGMRHSPMFFGRDGRNRFDAPAGEYGVLYAADDEYGAFVETFGHRTGIRFVAEADLAARALARVEASRPLRLVDLTGSLLARLGADARVTAGEDYGLSQRWARACWLHPAQPDGLYYRSRHDPSRGSVALFDRSAPVLSAVPLGSFGDRTLRRLLGAILDHYDFGIG